MAVLDYQPPQKQAPWNDGYFWMAFTVGAVFGLFFALLLEHSILRHANGGAAIISAAVGLSTSSVLAAFLRRRMVHRAAAVVVAYALAFLSPSLVLVSLYLLYA
jgi:hypothetical protein